MPERSVLRLFERLSASRDADGVQRMLEEIAWRYAADRVEVHSQAGECLSYTPPTGSVGPDSPDGADLDQLHRWVVECVEPLYVPWVPDDPRVVGGDREVGSCYVLPLDVWGRVYGTMAITWRERHSLCSRSLVEIRFAARLIAARLALDQSESALSRYRRSFNAYSDTVHLMTNRGSSWSTLGLVLELGMHAARADYAAGFTWSDDAWYVALERGFHQDMQHEVEQILGSPSETDPERFEVHMDGAIVVTFSGRTGRPIAIVFGRTVGTFSTDELALLELFGNLTKLLAAERSRLRNVRTVLYELLKGVVEHASEDRRAWLDGPSLARDVAARLGCDGPGQDLAAHLACILLLLSVGLTNGGVGPEPLDWLHQSLPLISPDQRSKEMLPIAVAAAEYMKALSEEHDAWSALRRTAELPCLDRRVCDALEAVVSRGTVEGFGQSDARLRQQVLRDLTAREQEVLRCIARGLKNREIADALVISEKTVKVHVSSIFQKIGIADRTKAAVFAVRIGILPGRQAFDVRQQY